MKKENNMTHISTLSPSGLTRRSSSGLTPIKRLLHIALCSVLLFSSCSLFFEHEADDVQSSISSEESQNKTYLSINIGNKTAAKTIRPNTVSVTSLTNFNLLGKNLDTFESKLIAQAENIADFPTQIEITPGSWEFSLYASYRTALYSATTPAIIQPGVNNQIFFMLRPEGEFGDFTLTVDLTDNTGIAKVNAKLKSITDEIIDTKEFTLTDTASRIIEYSKALSINFFPS